MYDASVIAYPAIVHQHGLVTAVTGLHLRLDSTHFEDSVMRVKCLTSVPSFMHDNAAEARESGVYTVTNKKTNNGQRKPPLTESREVSLLGKCIIKWPSSCRIHISIPTGSVHCSTAHYYVICLTLRSPEFSSQPLIFRHFQHLISFLFSHFFYPSTNEHVFVCVVFV